MIQTKKQDQATGPFAPYVAILIGLGVEAAPAKLQKGVRGGDAFDGWLRLEGARGAEDWAIVEKPRVDRAALGPVIEQMKRLQKTWKRAILVTQHVTPPIAEDLRREGIAFVDAAGNAFLADKGFYILVTHHRPKPREGRVRQGIHAAGLKLLFVLLQARRVPATQREIADRAGIALGGVGRILRDLEQRGWIRKTGPDRFELEDPAAMLQRWVEGYAETLRPRLILRTCRRKPGTDLAEPARIAKAAEWQEKVLVGGELGAELLTGHLRPTEVTLHIPEADERGVLKRFDLVPDPQGDVVLIRNFGKVVGYEQPKVGWPNLADPLLVYAELLVQPDDRLREVAEMLRRDCIEPRWK